MARVRYTLHQRLFVYNTYTRKRSFKTCRRKFMKHFPGISVPSKRAIQDLVKKFHETGSVADKKINRTRTVLTKEKLNDISARLENSPDKSLSKVAQQAGVSLSSVWTATQLLGLKPYRTKAKIQALKKTSTKGDKKKKKEIAEEIAQLELQLEKQQNGELEELRQVTENTEEVVSTPEPSAPRISKAQRRRDRKAVKEREQEQMIIEAEAENVHGPRNVETQKIKQMLKGRSLMLEEIPSDGNCLYCAVNDQLKRLGDNSLGVEKLRKMTSQHLLDHKSDFLPFLSHPDTGDVLSDTQYEEYCNEVADTPAWGGELELRALSHVLKCCIEVIQATGPSIMLGEEYQDLRRVVLTFHRHMYGLGEHYNSVKPYKEEEEEEEETEKTT